MPESRSIATLAPGRRAPLEAALLLTLAVSAAATPALAQCPNENRLYISDPFLSIGYLNRLDNVFTPQASLPPSNLGGIAVNRSLTKAYIADYSGGQIIDLDLLTGTWTTIGAALSGPYGVRLNAAETDLWVTSAGGGTLMTINIASGFITGAVTGLSSPRGFAVDSQEQWAYVAEVSTGNIARVDLNAMMVIPGATGGITAPQDVAINATDSMLYVTDTNAGTLYKVSPFGGIATPVTTMLGAPFGVAVNAAETSAFVVTAGGQVIEVALPLGMTTPLNMNLGTPVGVQLTSSPCQTATLSPSNPAPGPGSRVAVCMHIDMRNSPETLGSYGATMTWDPMMLSYVSYTGGDAPFDTPIVNATNSGMGILQAADADAGGAAGAPHLLCMEFDVNGPVGSNTAISLGLTSISGAGTFNDLSTTAVASGVAIDVQGLCVVGDVNDSSTVNSGDALIILSNEIMLPLPANLQAYIAAGCGDADGDTFTDSVDADIVLTSEVGLPINPSFPVNAPIVTFDTCPSCSAPPPAAPPSQTGLLLTEAAAVGAPEVPVTLSFTNTKPKKGDLFEVVLAVDMGPSGEKLGSYAAHLSWPVDVADYVGASKGTAPAFAKPILNAGEAAAGMVRFAQADPAGAGGTLQLVRLQFRAKHALPHIEKSFHVVFSSMGTPGPGFLKLAPVEASQQAARATPVP